jgi:hypothetical protein
MAKKLKTYETSLGFFDLAIAAPSMKAALEAWGADSNLFHQGAAKQSEDPDVVAATMVEPGVVLDRQARIERGTSAQRRLRLPMPYHQGSPDTPSQRGWTVADRDPGANPDLCFQRC